MLPENFGLHRFFTSQVCTYLDSLAAVDITKDSLIVNLFFKLFPSLKIQNSLTN